MSGPCLHRLQKLVQPASSLLATARRAAATAQKSQTRALVAWRPLRPSAPAAPFTASAGRPLKAMPRRPPPPPEDEIEEHFVKGSGPGGQKINKTNSAVQLMHKPTGIVVKSQATRSRSQNRTIARQKLALRLDELRNGDQSRTAIVADSKRGKKASAQKKSRRKYRKLEEEKEAAVAAAAGEPTAAAEAGGEAREEAGALPEALERAASHVRPELPNTERT